LALTGSGNIMVSGIKTESLTVTLSGSGNLLWEWNRDLA
jgi:hypothetical protein